MTPDWRIVIAFDEPPASFHFVRAKSGKSWFRRIDGLVWAKELARQLSDLGIHGIIKHASDDREPQGFMAEPLDAKSRKIAIEMERQEARLLDREQAAQAKAALSRALRGTA